MTCEHCGAALPPVAQFCGRCGRSVGVSAPPASPAPCPVCATVPFPGDRYCGECGTRLGVPIGAPPPAIIGEPDPEPEPEPAPEPEHVPESEPAPEHVSEREDAPESPSDWETLWEPAPEPDPQLAVVPEPLPAQVPPTPAEPVRFVLQFSTGESVSVIGTGLLGRNPRPEPGEAIDHIVIVSDPTRSMSKTHLEFGHDDGVFWVSDRHSGNGTVLREPGQLPRYCEPGRRYHIARGTRVDMGDQFMILG